MLLDDHRDVTRFKRLTVEGRTAGQQCADVGGKVAADVLTKVVDRQILYPVAAQRCAAYHAEPKRVVVRRPGKPVTLVMRVDIVNDDRGIAEFGPAQHSL